MNPLTSPIRTLIFGLLAQTGRSDLWVNIWFFLHFVQSPLEVFAASDQRLLNMNYARALLPTVLFSYAAPLLALVFYPDTAIGEHLTSIQEFFPALISVIHSLFARAVSDTTKRDRFYNVKADLPSIRRACLIVCIASATTLQYIRYQTSTFGWLRSALYAGTLPPPPLSALKTAFLNDAHSALYVGGFWWLALLFKDLKKARMIQTSWMWLLLCAAASTAIIGPGATLVAGWAWREEVLASKKHWAAVTKAC